MRSAIQATGTALLALVVIVAKVPAVMGQEPTEVPVQLLEHATIPSEFVGAWDYNPAESINVATGRPEQAPRSATQRGVAGAGGGGARGGGGGGGRAGGGNRGGDLGVGPTPAMMREARDMSRDLLEVPEALSISMAGGAISFTDDIDRHRAYPLDGTKNKYRLGASEFSARVRWTGTQLRKDVEGSFGFKMSETYYLSPDAQRLFVIIRITTDGRPRQPQGVNRVYDRLPAGATRRPIERTAVE